MKKHMTKQEEFDIMKLVLDKFLWLGIIIMALGFYTIISRVQNFWYGFWVLVAGAIILILFSMLLVREYNFIK